MATTSIEWTDLVWNPVSGCSHVSIGCKNCYAERMDRRQMMPGRKDGFRPWTAQNAEYNVRLHPERLEQPLHWRKPRRVFVNSMSDLFHERVPFEFIAAVFGVMAHSKHIYQVLTKRPKRALEFFDWLGALRGPCGSAPCDPLGGCEIQAARHLPVEWSVEVANLPSKPSWPLPNVHLLVSAENQATLDERVRWLFRTPAAVRGVSLEPLLGPVNVTPYIGGRTYECRCGFHDTESELIFLGGDHYRCAECDEKMTIRGAVSWVVVGGESGPGARPMHPDWVRAVRDQCQEAGVPFLFKQWGAWAPKLNGHKAVGERWGTLDIEGEWFPTTTPWNGRQGEDSPTKEYVMCRVGKKAAGRELDGRTWNEFPEVKRG